MPALLRSHCRVEDVGRVSAPCVASSRCLLVSHARTCSENPDAAYSNSLLANNAERREKENGDGEEEPAASSAGSARADSAGAESGDTEPEAEPEAETEA